MLQTRTAINIYSDLNPHINIVILLKDDSDMEKATAIIFDAYDKWFDLDSELDLQFEPIGDYIKSCLDAAGIHHEIYFKAQEEK